MSRKENMEVSERQDSATIADIPIRYRGEDKFGYYEEAELFLDKLKEQRDSYQENALIVGLEGKWGEGKSSFINMIECAVSDSDKYSNFKLINFSSWNYRSTNQLTIELLSAISEAVGLKEVSIVIDKYIKVFEGTSFQWLTNLTRIFCSDTKTTQEYFNDVNEELRKSPQTLIVAIDDIDRLVKEEVLEVLKLVRNTANFRKIVYVVAYDKGYVEQTLKECGIRESQKYLEKIFNVPFLLPEKGKKQTEEVYKEILQKNIFFKRTSQTDRGIETFVKHFGDDLSTRNVKRLAKQLLINTPFVRQDGMTFELDIYDCLILYFLNIKYKKMFETLRALSLKINDTNMIHVHDLIYSSNGIVSMNLANGHTINKDGIFDYTPYMKQYIVPVVGEEDAKPVLELIKGLFRYSYAGYDKTAYCMQNVDVYPIFFTKKFPKDYVKTDVFIDASKKATFPEMLREWNASKNRSMLGCVISYLRYEDYTREEFIFLFRTIISEVTIKENRTKNTSESPQDKTLCIIPGISCQLNFKSEDYRNIIKEVIENIEYDNTFSQRFSLLMWGETYRVIYDRDYSSYLSICNKYLDVYLSHENKFDNFNCDFWSMPLSIYNGTYNDKDLGILQEKCKKHILQNIVSFKENWSKNINNNSLACVFSKPLMIKGYFDGGWQTLFYDFLRENKEIIGEEMVNSFHEF